MRIYHGCPSPAKMRKVRKHAPSYEHGCQWNPDKMTPHDEAYFLDNGCYAANLNDELWESDDFLRRLGEIPEKMPRDPDFVVVPDVPGEADATFERSLLYVREVREFGYPYLLPVQDGVGIKNAISLADAIGAAGIFIGGSNEWKRYNTRRFVKRARERDLWVHVGSPPDLLWAGGIGVDSVDTTSIVRNEDWHKLRRLEQQDSIVA